MNHELIKNIKDYINSLLGPLDNHYYHEYEHALEVMERSLYLGKKEGLENDALEILAIASLFHDSGFIIQYDNNEYIGAKIAKNYLSSINYPKERIEIIEELIISTIYGNHPKNILESIIKDSDVDNFGREDFFGRGKSLKKEIETIKKIKIKEPEWYHFSLDLLKSHKFYTNTQKKERVKSKEKNIIKLKKLIK